MTAAKQPESGILLAIREAEKVDFDLTDEVVSEMRLVGVSASVIKAMKARLGETPHTDTATRQSEGTIEVVFERGKAPATEKRPGPALPRAAFFMICVDPTHVPDYWATKTPLAGKFPRHHLLWFQEPPLIATDSDGKKEHRPKPTWLPPPARVALVTGEHPIQAGIAVWDPDKTWNPIAVASRTLDVTAGGTVRLVLSVSTHKLPAKQVGVTVEIVEPAAVAVPSAGRSPAP